MDDILPTKSRHGHSDTKALWWLDHAVVDQKPISFMIMFGSRIIGDKACYRIGNTPEIFFDARSVQRNEIILQGKELIRASLTGRTVLRKDGAPYDWNIAEVQS